MTKERNIGTLTLDGGNLCFHFINTVYAWRGENLKEYLDNYTSVVQWCKKVQLYSAAGCRQLQQQATLHPEKAAAALNQLHAVRQVLYRLFSAIAADKVSQLPATVTAAFNKALADALQHLQFTAKSNVLQRSFVQDTTHLMAPLWHVMYSAFEVLTQQDRSRIKECESCGWIFYDTTKNHARRWCSPISCGSISKSKTYYYKKKTAGNEPAAGEE